ncbi:hydrogenase maturation nickel metallochaperone HypA/HybF [Phytohabitans suffuscus]|uniref:hydrogenase maturation nickel metallochaperone HypA/HybF n=1 Tax=Phytohabitans suffuscus TaxID=624315 RepID=UPI00156795CA|nr:hydrogenase maturation nickel metallochaperone HypA [Phytohabitans suffuscus]
MHEFAITQSVVDAACERAAGRRVRSVRVRVGALTAVVPEAMRFCFDLVSEGTSLEGARLDIDQRPGIGLCRTCGRTVSLDDHVLLCHCGSADLAVVSGRELEIVSMEVG